MSKMSDLDLLFQCCYRMEERRRAVLGDGIAVVLPADEDCASEKLMHGDYIDANDLDKFARVAGFVHYRTMQNYLEEIEGYSLAGGIVGIIEEAVLVGIMWEKERKRLVAEGSMEEKLSDIT